MSTEMADETYVFDWTSSPDLSPFIVDLATAVKSRVPAKGKNGDYIKEEWSVVVTSGKISTPLTLKGISTKNWNRIKVLTLSRLINLTVTRGMIPQNQPNGFAPYIISGVA